MLNTYKLNTSPIHPEAGKNMSPPTQPVAVIGGGIAGLTCALELAELGLKVIVYCKGKLDQTNTSLAQGGIAAVYDPKDSYLSHIQDTFDSGCQMGDQIAIQLFSKDSTITIQKLIQWGSNFDTDKKGNLLFAMEGAHQNARILRANGDGTGKELQRALSALASQNRSIKIVSNVTVNHLDTDENGIKGLQYLDHNSITRKAKHQHLVLASGGAGQMFSKTSNSHFSTGDGIILAHMAGAYISDMEFYQFHPTVLDLKGAPPFLISEAVRGEGAILRDKNGKPIMENIHPLKDLAPRDVVARQVHTFSQNGNGVYLDITSMSEKELSKRFPKIFAHCLKHGINISKDWIPIAPAAHYMIGGVHIDYEGRTSINGLYACGEVARSGIHGANRLASNSLMEGAIYGIRVAHSIKQNTPWKTWKNNSILHKLNPSKPMSVSEFQKAMWSNLGVVRNLKNLIKLRETLKEVFLINDNDHTFTDFELFSLKNAALIMTESAIQRTKSIGCHYLTN
jgi:L-aspartate oxidase